VTDPNAPPSGPTGLLIIDKPLGLTSMAICRKVRWLLVQGGAPRKMKVGHGGTLDPLATGVLVILTGKATRLCDRVMAGEKRYTAEIDLAHISPTDDRESESIPVPIQRIPTREEIVRACAAFVGSIQQKPPAYSAIWIEGERAYNLARRSSRAGSEDLPQMQARAIDIHTIDILEYDFPRLTVDIRCGKGTYIRSLARDIGLALSTGGMLAALRRTAVGPFTIDQARDFQGLPEPLTQQDLLPIPQL
jgi:tRNA pseudouridine55 synthase